MPGPLRAPSAYIFKLAQLVGHYLTDRFPGADFARHPFPGKTEYSASNLGRMSQFLETHRGQPIPATLLL
jgi:hypothetical protein